MQTQKDRERLFRIVTMLISLSCLAESASRRFWLVRVLLLRILRPAEAVALQFVSGLVVLAPHIALEFQIKRSGSRPADLLLLAQRLRMLAAVLDAAIVSGGLNGAKIRWAVSDFVEKIASLLENMSGFYASHSSCAGRSVLPYCIVSLPAPDTS